MATPPRLLDRLLALHISIFYADRRSSSNSELALSTDSRSRFPSLTEAQQQLHRGDETRVLLLETASTMPKTNNKVSKEARVLEVASAGSVEKGATEGLRVMNAEEMEDDVWQEGIGEERRVMRTETKAKPLVHSNIDLLDSPARVLSRKPEQTSSNENNVTLKQTRARLDWTERGIESQADIFLHKLRDLQDIHIASLHNQHNNLGGQEYQLQGAFDHDLTVSSSSYIAEVKAIRVDLKSARHAITALKETVAALSEDKLLLERRLAEKQMENGNLKQRIDEVRGEKEIETRKAQVAQGRLETIVKDGREEMEKIYKRVEESDRYQANSLALLARKDAELSQRDAKVVNLEESEKRLKREHEEMRRTCMCVVAELESVRVKIKKAEKETEESSTECKKLHREVVAANLQLKQARAEHKKELASKDRELAQAVANAVVLEGNSTIAFADHLNFDKDLSEVCSDRSSTKYGSDEHRACPSSMKTSANEHLRESPRFSIPEAVTSGKHAVYGQIQELRCALEHEKHAAEELREHVGILMECVALKEMELARRQKLAGRPKVHCSPKGMGPPLNTTVPPLDKSPTPRTPVANPNPSEWKRTKSAISPVQIQAENSFRSSSRLVRMRDDCEETSPATAELNQSHGDVSSRHLSRILAASKWHKQAPDVYGPHDPSTRLDRLMKKGPKRESNGLSDIAMPKTTTRVLSLRRLRNSVGMNLRPRR